MAGLDEFFSSIGSAFGIDSGDDKSGQYSQYFESLLPILMNEAGYELIVTEGALGQSTYTWNKKPDARIQQAIDKYGAGSEEVSQVERKIQEEQTRNAELNASIEQNYLEAVDKFVRGDLSLFPGQEQYLNDSFNRQLEISKSVFDDVRSEVAQTNMSVSGILDSYDKLIDQSGIDRNNALDIVAKTIEQGGENVKKALEILNQKITETDETVGKVMEKSFAEARKLADLGLTQQAEQMQGDIARKAALYGRNPTDPSFQKELLDRTQDNIIKVNYMLGIDEANKRVGLASETGAKRENLASVYANLESQLGAARTGVAAERYGIVGDVYNQKGQVMGARSALAESSGRRLEDIALAQGQYTNQLASQREQNRYNFAAGLPVQQGQVGMSLDQLQSMLKGQDINNMSQIFGMASAPYQMETQKQAYQRDFLDYLNTLGTLGLAGGSIALAA